MIKPKGTLESWGPSYNPARLAEAAPQFKVFHVTYTSAAANGVVIQDSAAYMRKLRRRIRGFEKRYEMPTATMKARLDERTLTETAEIAEWLYDDTALAMLEGREELSTAG